MLAVSPSPLTPMPSMLWFIIIAPVATDGIRPCSELNPCDWLRKQVGDLLEQPMPLNFIKFVGLILRRKATAMIWLEIESWPQPAL